ncbi:Death-associated protein kinase 3 [Apodemus speciosus]|uniref:Death-associated protein kinase 3 n=1 Tax=Apodemus speciosus TaxID=105296 RepID=A0ABQ0F8B4_APOSI
MGVSQYLQVPEEAFRGHQAWELETPVSPESCRRSVTMSTFRQEDVEDHYEMGEELGRLQTLCGKLWPGRPSGNMEARPVIQLRPWVPATPEGSSCVPVMHMKSHLRRSHR